MENSFTVTVVDGFAMVGPEALEIIGKLIAQDKPGHATRLLKSLYFTDPKTGKNMRLISAICADGELTHKPSTRNKTRDMRESPFDNEGRYRPRPTKKMMELQDLHNRIRRRQGLPPKPLFETDDDGRLLRRSSA